MVVMFRMNAEALVESNMWAAERGRVKAWGCCEGDSAAGRSVMRYGHDP